jgi:hypothetical protein
MCTAILIAETPQPPALWVSKDRRHHFVTPERRGTGNRSLIKTVWTEHCRNLRFEGTETIGCEIALNIFCIGSQRCKRPNSQFTLFPCMAVSDWVKYTTSRRVPECLSHCWNWYPSRKQACHPLGPKGEGATLACGVSEWGAQFGRLDSGQKAWHSVYSIPHLLKNLRIINL